MLLSDECVLVNVLQVGYKVQEHQGRVIGEATKTQFKVELLQWLNELYKVKILKEKQLNVHSLFG